MRYRVLSPATLLLLVVGIGGTSRPAYAQNPFDALKKKAEAAKARIDEAKRKSDSVTAAAQRKADAALGKVDSAVGNTQGAESPSAAARGNGATGGRSSRTAAGPAAVQTAASPSGPLKISRTAAKVEEQVLAMGEPGMQYALSPRGQHLAAVMLRGSRQVVVYDGVDGPKFDELTSATGGRIVFSEDGGRWAYVGRQGNEWVVMVDGKELARGSPWAQVSGLPVIKELGFTPGGAKHLWFRTDPVDTQHPVSRIYIDGKPGPASEAEMAPLFSPDGEHYAYVIDVRNAGRSQPTMLILDGKPSPYPGGEPQFTTDGQHVFTRAAVPGTSTIDIFLDGKPFMRAGGAQLYMAPLGAGMLGAVLTQFPGGRSGTSLTVGNRRVPNGDCPGGGIDRVYFSADAKHWAVRCHETSSYWIMADGKKGQQYQSISSDVAFTADGTVVYRAVMGGKTFVVVGDQESAAYQSVELMQRQVPCGPGVSQCEGGQAVVAQLLPAVISGKHVGYIALPVGPVGSERLVVIDGKALKATYPAELTFSADGSRFGFLTGASRSAQLVLDGAQPMAPVVAPRLQQNGVPMFLFSPDSRHVAFATSVSGGYDGNAIALDGRVVRAPVTTGNFDLTFTPDSRHLLWIGQEPGAQKYAVFVDGEPVLETDATSGLQNDPGVYSSMGSDGVWTVVAQSGGAMKRFRITPGTGSVDAMLASAH